MLCMVATKTNRAKKENKTKQKNNFGGQHGEKTVSELKKNY